MQPPSINYVPTSALPKPFIGVGQWSGIYKNYFILAGLETDSMNTWGAITSMV